MGGGLFDAIYPLDNSHDCALLIRALGSWDIGSVVGDTVMRTTTTLIIALTCLIGQFWPISGRGDWLDSLADAVYKAEGGKRASVPYGLVNDAWCVKEGACRYYAKEVLRVHVGRCRGSTDLIACVGSYYAPIKGVSDWERSYNVSWVSNVRYFLERGIQ